jgi:hypothetical protein
VVSSSVKKQQKHLNKPPLSEVFMLFSCLFCRSVARYQHIAVVSFAENRLFSGQDGSDNRPIVRQTYEKVKIDSPLYLTEAGMNDLFIFHKLAVVPCQPVSQTLSSQNAPCLERLLYGIILYDHILFMVIEKKND